MPGAIRCKNRAAPPRNAVVCQRNWAEFGRGHHCAAGFTENLGLFEVPYLCAVASVLKRHCSRATDLAVRYGGEEFVCLLPDTDGDQAALIAEKIRQAVVALQLPNGGGSPPWLTVSIGVVTMRNERSMELASFKALADERLYMAKSAGRNRISAWVA